MCDTLHYLFNVALLIQRGFTYSMWLCSFKRVTLRILHSLQCQGNPGLWSGYFPRYGGRRRSIWCVCLSVWQCSVAVQCVALQCCSGYRCRCGGRRRSIWCVSLSLWQCGVVVRCCSAVLQCVALQCCSGYRCRYAGRRHSFCSLSKFCCAVLQRCIAVLCVVVLCRSAVCRSAVLQWVSL